MAANFVRIWCMLMLAAISAAFAGDGVQTIVQGQSTTLSRDYTVGDVAVADPRVCDFVVRDSRREIYINARGAGNTTLTIWDDHGVQRDVVPVIVTPVDVAALKHQVQRAAGGAAQVEFVRRGDDIVMVGEVGSEQALSQVQSLTQAEPRLRSEVRLGGAALDTLADTVTKAINRPGITARRVRDRIVLEGIAYSAEAAQHAEKIAAIYNPSVLNLLEVRNTGRSPGERPLVYLDVYFLEVKRSALRSFGIRWSPGASRANSGGQGVGGLLSSSLGFVIDMLPKLQMARERGEARILEHPSLIVKSGEKGDFFSGTEIPYASAQQTQFKEVGIRIEAEPITSGKSVDLKLNISVSAPAAGVNGSIDRRSIATSAYCNDGETLVLGGLWNNGQAVSRNKVPSGVDTSSALFSLALSKDFQSQQSDFLIFVQPRVASANERGTDAMRQWESLQQALTAPPKKVRGAADRWERAPRGRSAATEPTLPVDAMPAAREARALRAVADVNEKNTRPPRRAAADGAPVLTLPEALR